MITEQEKQKRIQAINFARGSVRLEGVILSKEIEELNKKYINGEYSDEEFLLESRKINSSKKITNNIQELIDSISEDNVTKRVKNV